MQLNIKLNNKENLLVNATLLKNTPIKCFAHRDVTNSYKGGTDAWLVSEFFSGLRITKGKRTRREAIEEAMMVFEEKGVDAIKEIVNERVAVNGFANKDGTQRRIERI